MWGLSSTTEAMAANSNCWKETHTRWHCHWGDNPTAPDHKVWFQSSGGNNLRGWDTVEARDPASYDVAKKCVGVKDTNGSLHAVACGAGTVTGNPAWSPTWVYVRHWADGSRNIFGHGYHNQ